MMKADSADPEYPDLNFAQEKEIETYIQCCGTGTGTGTVGTVTF
jgi:hypothetical protein